MAARAALPSESKPLTIRTVVEMDGDTLRSFNIVEREKTIALANTAHAAISGAKASNSLSDRIGSLELAVGKLTGVIDKKDLIGTVRVEAAGGIVLSDPVPAGSVNLP